MLEILILWQASVRLGNVAKEKGRPAALGALFAAGWIIGEIFGAIVGLVMTGETFTAYLFFGLPGAILGGVVAWLIVANLPPAHGQPAASGLQAPGVMSGTAALAGAGVATPALATADVPAPPPPPRPARRAGYCMDCGQNVWLTGAGACPNGHGPQSLTNCYTVER